ncbi:ATP-binding SpoIIE family protein phosphatase [Streptomyces bottropensis]|uniref:ATP-binding SpoIIE family protein phosphatase n=1 Tax=Streptomyces TaxID=1883 RepID=UPI00034AF0F2|nr:ATP-binding SpoIIE family protein phosphatase [Streptomyces bottropensis]
MGAIPTQRDTVSCASDAPARVGSESLYAAPAYAGLDRRATAHLSLQGGPLAPGAARRFVGAALTEWAELGLPGAAAFSVRLVEDVLVVVSELVTNAVVHAGTDVELLCRLGRDAPTAPGWLLLEVSDHHPSRAVRGEGAERPYLVERPYGAAEYGRGLRLVAALSEAWGITYRTGVKTVWAQLSVDGAMAVEGAFEPYGGHEGGSAAEAALGDRADDAWDARAYAGDSAQDVRPVDLVAPVPRPGGEHDREWLNRGALSFLAEASDLLTGQLDEDLVAALAGQLLVPRLADWCAVWLEEEGLGWRAGDASFGPAPRLARVWHGSENRIEELRRALEKNPPRLPDAVRSRAVPVPWPELGEGAGTEATEPDTERGAGSGRGTGSTTGDGAAGVARGPAPGATPGPAEETGTGAGGGPRSAAGTASGTHEAEGVSAREGEDRPSTEREAEGRAPRSEAGPVAGVAGQVVVGVGEAPRGEAVPMPEAGVGVLPGAVGPVERGAPHREARPAAVAEGPASRGPARPGPQGSGGPVPDLAGVADGSGVNGGIHEAGVADGSGVAGVADGPGVIGAPDEAGATEATEAEVAGVADGPGVIGAPDGAGATEAGVAGVADEAGAAGATEAGVAGPAQAGAGSAVEWASGGSYRSVEPAMDGEAGAPRRAPGPPAEHGGRAARGRGGSGPEGEGGAALAYRLIAGGRPLGTLVIGRAGLLRFPDEVTGLVEDLSRRIALSIGAARQYARQATISRVLQRGLLPGAVAEIPGVSSALVYEPCDKGGPSGDFYDLFPAGRGRWCFAIGDVQGKGPEAAVVIGLARPWLRLLAREGYGVADVLDRLNQLLLDDATEAADAAARALVTAGDPGLVDPDGPQTRFLSLLYGELVPVDGGVRCTLASAGHPLPLLLGPDGDVRAVAEPQTLLGVIEDTEYVSETFELRRGDTLLCVTDGVTERRSGPRMFDDGDGLACALSGCAGLDAQLIAERIRRLVHEFGEGPPDDDLALLVLRAE